MNEHRKNAYRYLLYRAMLSIRQLSWIGIPEFGRSWLSVWNPFSWRRELQRIRYAGSVADWLHHMAFFSTIDFEGFSEQCFWRDFERLRSDYPQYQVEVYRTVFDEYIAKAASTSPSPPGTSP